MAAKLLNVVLWYGSGALGMSVMWGEYTKKFSFLGFLTFPFSVWPIG